MDANDRRQRRHDAVKRSTTCPRCGAWPGHPCYELRQPYNAHVYPDIRSLYTAAMSTGKTLANLAHVEGQIMRTDWGRMMRGLHKERWAAYRPEAIDELAKLVEVIDVSLEDE